MVYFDTLTGKWWDVGVCSVLTLMYKYPFCRTDGLGSSVSPLSLSLCLCHSPLCLFRRIRRFGKYPANRLAGGGIDLFLSLKPHGATLLPKRVEGRGKPFPLFFLKRSRTQRPRAARQLMGQFIAPCCEVRHILPALGEDSALPFRVARLKLRWSQVPQSFDLNLWTLRNRLVTRFTISPLNNSVNCTAWSFVQT